MTVNARSIATLGIGFGALAIASLGFLVQQTDLDQSGARSEGAIDRGHLRREARRKDAIASHIAALISETAAKTVAESRLALPELKASLNREEAWQPLKYALTMQDHQYRDAYGDFYHAELSRIINEQQELDAVMALFLFEM